MTICTLVLRRHARSSLPSRNTLLSRAVVAIHPEIKQFSSTDASAVKKQSSVKAYMDLSKAKLSSLVVATTAAGFIAAGGPLCPMTLGACCTGTMLCSSSAAAFNQIFEVGLDKKMKRTQQRPLVQGTLTTTQATVAASLWGVAGTTILAYGTDPVTTSLGLGNIVLYSGLYTYMKAHSVYNTWVGAIVGAVPPVMGWTAATGGHIWDIEAVMLGSTLYLWQMPHFFALSYMYRADYARGGFQMIPVLEPNGDQTSRIVVRYTWYLSSIPVLCTLTEITSSMFFLEGLVLNAYALHVAHKFRRERTNANARKVFLTSLWYLPSLLMLFLLHSKRWDMKESEKDNVLVKAIAHNIHTIRNKGRELCIHESAVVRTDHDKGACPVVIGEKKSKQAVEAASTVVSLSEKQT